MNTKQTLILKRPKPRAVITLAVGFPVAAAVIRLMIFVAGINPGNLTGRILNSVCFVLLWICALLASAFALSAVRDLFCSPSVILDGTSLRVYGFEPLSVSDIADMETDSKCRNLFVTAGDGTVINIKQRNINIPVETLKYAIQLRIDAVKLAPGKTPD